MRKLFACALFCLALMSGCFWPKGDALAPNYNPAAERDDFPAPSKSDVPRGSGSRSTESAPSRGRGSVFKDVEGQQ